MTALAASPTLIVLAAGLSTRYGGDKQLESIGPGGETLMDYGIYDAVRAGFGRAAVVTRPDLDRALREHLLRIFEGSIAIELVHQKLDDLPDGFSLPAGRRKPWGTGQAVLATRSRVAEPFVVMNADDFYGAAAFALLAEHLRRHGSAQSEYAAAGYRLRDTLSPHGGVSRAVCDTDEHGYLRRVTEVKNVRRRDDGALRGQTVAGEPVELEGDEMISMNLWAATPDAYALLERDFARFLSEHGDELEAEFLLSTSVNDHIERGEMRVRVIPTPGPWLGMTFGADRPYVVERIRERVERGEYPAQLAGRLGGDSSAWTAR